MDAVKAEAEAAGPSVVEEIQAWSNWKAPAFFSCTSGVLLWGQLHTVMAGSLATDLDTALGSHNILQDSFRYRAPARKGLWKAEGLFAGKSLPLGYVCHHVDVDGPDLLRRAVLVGVSFNNDHADGDIVYINRYDWAEHGCREAGFQLMEGLLKPEKKPKAEKTPEKSKSLKASKWWDTDDEYSSEDEEDEEYYDSCEDSDEDIDEEEEAWWSYEEGLISNRLMLVDEEGFPQLVQSLRAGFQLDEKNYLFRDGRKCKATAAPADLQGAPFSSDAFGINLGVGDDDNELGWMAFLDGELVGFVYDGVYCDLEGTRFQCGDTEVCGPDMFWVTCVCP